MKKILLPIIMLLILAVGVFGMAESKTVAEENAKTQVESVSSNASQNEPYSVVVKTRNGELHVREKASNNGKVLLKVYDGDKLTVIGKSGSDWLKVTVDDVTGYVPSKYVTQLNPKTITASDLGRYVLVSPKHYFVRLRELPGTSSTTVGIYYMGYELKVIGENGKYYRVLDEATGVSGFISKSQVVYSTRERDTEFMESLIQ